MKTRLRRFTLIELLVVIDLNRVWADGRVEWKRQSITCG